MELSSWVRIIVVTNLITEVIGIVYYGSVLGTAKKMGADVVSGPSVMAIILPLITYIIEVPVNILSALGVMCSKPKWTLPQFIVQFTSFLLYMILIVMLLFLMTSNESAMISLTHAFIFKKPKYALVEGEQVPDFTTQIIARYACLGFILAFIIIAAVKLWSAAAIREHKRVMEFKAEAKNDPAGSSVVGKQSSVAIGK